jgi:hypothetical protein
LRKTKSPTPGFKKMALLRTQITTLWNFWMRFLENMSFLETYGPFTHQILLHQTFICGEQQNLQCYHDCPCTLNELKTAITAYIRIISQADLHKVFANKIKWVQACTDAHGHHYYHLLEVHSDFPNALYKCDRNVYRMMGNVSSICCKFHMLQI